MVVVETNKSNIDVWIRGVHFNVLAETIYEDIRLTENFDIDELVDEFIGDTFEIEMRLTDEEKEQLRFHFKVIYLSHTC